MNKNNIFAGFTLLIILGIATIGVMVAGGFSPLASKDVDSQDKNVYGVIEGNILFEDLQSTFSDATVYIRLDDVSLADAPSTTIADTMISSVMVDMNEGEASIYYSLERPELDERFDYTIYVHVDVDGDEKVSKGDYVTTMHNSVNTTESDQVVDVTVSHVGGGNDEEQLPLTEIDATVTDIRDDDENVMITIVNRESEGSVLDEVVLVVGSETAIINALDGGLMSVDDIEVGSHIKAYYGPMMTMSIPPISPAKTIMVYPN